MSLILKWGMRQALKSDIYLETPVAAYQKSVAITIRKSKSNTEDRSKETSLDIAEVPHTQKRRFSLYNST